MHGVLRLHTNSVEPLVPSFLVCLLRADSFKAGTSVLLLSASPSLSGVTYRNEKHVAEVGKK